MRQKRRAHWAQTEDANGEANGQANGQANKRANGQANGQANGRANGEANGEGKRRGERGGERGGERARAWVNNHPDALEKTHGRMDEKPTRRTGGRPPLLNGEQNTTRRIGEQTPSALVATSNRNQKNGINENRPSNTFAPGLTCLT